MTRKGSSFLIAVRTASRPGTRRGKPTPSLSRRWFTAKYDGEIASTGFSVLRGANGIEPKYLYYKAISHDFVSALTGEQYGVSYPAVKDEQVKSQPLELAPTNEQRRIVEKIEALFDEIDAGIQSLQTARTTLGLYRQSLLKSAFEGRLTADWRAQNADKLEAPKTLLARIQKERDTRYKAALATWQEDLAKWRADGENDKKPTKPKRPAWPDKFDFSELRDLPDSWAYLPFEALAWSVQNGISAKPDKKGPLKIFRISAVRPMAFGLEDFRRITDPDGSFEDYRLSEGDLVFTRYNGSRDYVGVSAMYRGDGSHVYPDKLIRCEIRSDILNPAFLEAATNCGESRAYIERRIRTTAGQSGVSGGDIKAMPVPICSPAEQAQITRILGARLDAATRLEAEIDAALTRADALRQSILKKAFSGQLVPHDLSDEPAAALLAQIKAEKSKTPRTK
ncbi:restriction endonuclease subunit S [Roseovarius sp. M141]|uniref:restriction endonuclease subunit S n=1 Tax=Roseovarius sp. M141 TaxID=2583806 RepID=UPI0020CE3A7C|nr:restriction endonuclease subunit S [Roseovarius sp. M141]